MNAMGHIPFPSLPPANQGPLHPPVHTGSCCPRGPPLTFPLVGLIQCSPPPPSSLGIRPPRRPSRPLIPELMKQGQLLPLSALTSRPSPSLSRFGLVPRVLEGTAGEGLRNWVLILVPLFGRGRRSTFGCFLGHLELGWWGEAGQGSRVYAGSLIRGWEGGRGSRRSRSEQRVGRGWHSCLV